METIKKNQDFWPRHSSLVRRIKTFDQDTVAWSDKNNNIQLKLTNYVLTGKSDP